MTRSASALAELDGRTAAVCAVADALRGAQFVQEALRGFRAAGRLGGREAALATEVGLGAVRHVVTIEHVLGNVARFRGRRTPPLLRAIVYTAAYQIIWMDRVPLFAAVDEAVALATREVGRRAAGMANAVLRRLTGAVAERRVPWVRLEARQVRVAWDQACLFGRAVLPTAEGDDGAARHLAAATGERPARYAELCARYGAEQAESIAWAGQAVPVTVLQRNSLRVTPAEFAQDVRVAYGDSVEVAGDAAFVPATVAVTDAAPFLEGRVFVQDATAHAAAAALRARPGERVLDLCAAPGGKSVALALAMDDRGVVVACDTVPERLKRVSENVARLGLSCVRTRVTTPAGVEPLAEGEPFDAAFVDVPCANTGVIARRPEARLGLTAQKLDSLVKVQQVLLRKAAHAVRPGGRVVYSTCSLEPPENEQVVAAFLAANPTWRLDATETTLPAWGPRPADWRDGGYFARLLREE